MDRTRSPAHCYKSLIALPIVVVEKALWRSSAWSAIVHLLWGGGHGGGGYGFLFFEARTMESTSSCLMKQCWSRNAAIHNFEWNRETTWGLSRWSKLSAHCLQKERMSFRWATSRHCTICCWRWDRHNVPRLSTSDSGRSWTEQLAMGRSKT